MAHIYRDYILPAGILSGTIIGAGMFSLPFVFQKAGVWLGVGYLVLAAYVYTAHHLMFADLILRTPGRHRFVGYAKRYGGTPAFWFSVLIAVVQMVLVLTIYLVLEVKFVGAVVPIGSERLKLLIIWLISSIPIYASVKKVAWLEFVATGGIVAAVFFLFGYSLFAGGEVSTKNLHLSLNPFYVFLPLAPVLFSMAGRVAVPSVIDYFGVTHQARRHTLVRRAIVLGTAIPAIVYGVFIVSILFLSPLPSEDSLSGLVGILPPFVLQLGGFLAIISIWSSYFVVGISVNDILRDDLRWGSLGRALVVLIAPLVIYLMGFKNFLTLVSFVGGVLLAAEGLFVTFLWYRARRMTESVGFLGRVGWGTIAILSFTFLAAFLVELALILG